MINPTLAMHYSDYNRGLSLLPMNGSPLLAASTTQLVGSAPSRCKLLSVSMPMKIASDFAAWLSQIRCANGGWPSCFNGLIRMELAVLYWLIVDNGWRRVHDWWSLIHVQIPLRCAALTCHIPPFGAKWYAYDLRTWPSFAVVGLAQGFVWTTRFTLFPW